MRVLSAIVDRLWIAGELIEFFATHRWWWITPLIVFLLAIAGLVLFAQSSAIAPFIYTFF